MIEHPEVKFKQLSKDHADGKLPLGDLNKECAYWYLDTFNTFEPRPDPTPPNEYLDYRNMPFEKKSKVSPDFFKIESIKNYLEFRDKVKAENFAHTMRLKEFVEHIPKEDVVSRSKYQQKLYDFEVKDFN